MVMKLKLLFADCGGPNCSGCSGEKFCFSGRDCQSKICIGTGNNRRCSGFAENDRLANGGETDVDCGARVSTKCAEGYRCQTSEDCASQHTCVEYLEPVEGRFCAVVSSLRRPKPEYLSSINLGLQLDGVGKHNFDPLVFRSALGSVIGMPAEAVRLVALTDEIGPYPGDPETGVRRQLAVHRSPAFDYISGMNASLVVFTERWELRLILQRLEHLLHMRVVKGMPCYAGKDPDAVSQGSVVCSNVTLNDALVQLNPDVNTGEEGSNMLQLMRAATMPNLKSLTFVAGQSPRISATDQGPDIFYRPERMEFRQKIDYSSNKDEKGQPFWWAGELFPQPAVVILRDRHGRHIQDVTPDTQVTASLNEQEFPPTRNPVTKEILKMNPTRIAGPSTKLYLQGEASFDRIYVTSQMNNSRIYFTLEVNTYAAGVSVLASDPLIVRVRPEIVEVIPPPEVTHPVLILFATGVVLAAAGFCLIRACKARMWCRVPEREKRAGKKKVQPSTAPKLETDNYETHDVEQEEADAAKAADAAAKAAAHVETKATPFKNIALDVNNYSELAARLPKPAQTKAVGEGMFYGGERGGENPADGTLVSASAVTSAEHIFSHHHAFASVAAVQNARSKIDNRGTDAQLSGRMPQGDTARSLGEHEGQLFSTYNALGVAPPKRKKKKSVMQRMFGSSKDSGAEGEYDLEAPVQVQNPNQRARAGSHSSARPSLAGAGSSRRNAFVRQGSTVSVMSAGGMSEDDFGGSLEQIARGPLFQESGGTGVSAEAGKAPQASGRPPKASLMRSASSRSVRGLDLPTVSEK